MTAERRRQRWTTANHGKIATRFCVDLGVEAALGMYDRMMDLGHFPPRRGAPCGTTLMVRRTSIMDWCRSEEHTSELQSLMRISYAVFCLKKKRNSKNQTTISHITKRMINYTLQHTNKTNVTK